MATTTKGGIRDDEKANIRKNLFDGTIEEPDSVLALQNSLAAAKIIRIDYPRHWPQALPNMVESLANARKPGSNPMHVNGLLQIWLHVVKELSSARLKTSQTALQSNAPEISYVLAEIYAELVPVWEEYMRSPTGSREEADRAILNTKASLRTLRRLLIAGFQSPHKDTTVQQFWTLSQDHLGKFLKYISPDASPSCPWPEDVGKHVLQFTKLHVDMAVDRPSSFAALPGSLALVHAYWNELVIPFSQVFAQTDIIRSSASGTKATVERPIQERLTTRALLLIKACLDLAYLPKQTFAYRGPEAKEEEKQAIELVKTQLFTDEFVASIANTILTHLFVFRKSDLEAWEEDPEDWEHQQRFDSTAFEYEVRPCAEKVFISLLLNKKELLLPNLLSYIETAATPQADFATKDAVYTAMGLAAMHLVDRFDFNRFLATTLVPDAQQTGQFAKVLRRRIVTLLGLWVFTNMTAESRSTIYEMFRHFLNANDENNDTVVQLTAARNLQSIVEELDFAPELFAPHAAEILQSLTRLAQEAENEDTKLTILETIRLVVTRLETHVAPLGDYIMTTVTSAFQGSATDGYMVKVAIVGIYNALVSSMETNSQRYHPMMVSLIREAAQPESELHVSLVDEVLELWNSILVWSSPPIAPEIVSLAPLALPILTYASETATQALEAVESYIILAPEEVLGNELRRPFLEALAGMVDVKSREQAKKGSMCIEYLIRAAERLGGEEGLSVVIQDLLAVGFVRKMFEGLHDAWEARQTTGPRRKIPKLSAVAEGDYFAVLSRIAVASPSVFVQMIESLSPIEQAWPWLFGEWFAYMEGWDYIEHKKLTLLGLTRLTELESVRGLLLGQLQDFLSLWADTVAELQDGHVHGPDNQIWQEMEETEYDTPKIIRERELAMADPVHRVVAKQFVSEQLNALMSSVGVETFQQEWLANVDTTVVQKFSQFVMGG